MASLRDELDLREIVAGDRPAGPTELESASMLHLEREIEARTAESFADLLWRVRRIQRAAENDWRHELIATLAAAAERDVRALALR